MRELQSLCEAAVEGRLTPEQQAHLERLVLESPEARRFYTEYLHQHASLHWSAADAEGLPALARPLRLRRNRVAWAVAIAAALLVAVGVGWQVGTSRDATVATLAGGNACKWDSGTLPTEFGARLGPGRLRLAEGIARLVFDRGAEVTIEAPADVELVSPQRCILHAGRLVARVPAPAVGFVVDTPTAELTDFGTEFGVHVHDGQTADVQVFDGRVDGRHRTSGRTEAMATGKNLRFTADAVSELDLKAEKPPLGPSPRNQGADVVHLSTATGRGKDAYVQPVFPTKHRSDILLLVKNTVEDRSDYFRKALIGLDLTPLAGKAIVDAQLTLTFTPTGMGFASEVPDATFALYGLTDESQDGWDEDKVRWADAPAFDPRGASVDLTRALKIGTFEIAQGVMSGTRTVSGPALVAFLKQDTNGLATFILVRETGGSGRNDLVHGFASKGHPNLPPPTLKLTLAPRP